MSQAKKRLLTVIEAVAGVLGNTRAVCRKSYIHPVVIDAYMDGSLTTACQAPADAACPLDVARTAAGRDGGGAPAGGQTAVRQGEFVDRWASFRVRARPEGPVPAGRNPRGRLNVCSI